jgi:hypothetical protein
VPRASSSLVALVATIALATSLPASALTNPGANKPRLGLAVDSAIRATVSGAPVEENLIDQVASTAATEFPSTFSSVMATNGGAHIVVYLTQLAPDVEATLSNMAAPGGVSFALAPWTKAQILATQDQIVGDWGLLDAQGINVVSIFPSINSDALVHIGVENLTTAQLVTLNTDFGAAHIVVTSVAPADIPQAASCAVNRLNDCNPWTGGDNISNYLLTCTSGPELYNYVLNLTFTMTASHCFTNGQSIYNTYNGYGGALMGTQYNSDLTSGGDDTALLSINPNSGIWAGPLGSPYLDPINIGAATNPVGYYVYDEGAMSGELRSVVQNNYLGCLSFYYDNIGANRRECNLVESQATNNGEAVQAGDSGGSVIRPVGGPGPGNLTPSYDYISGIVSAGAGAVTCQGNKWETPCYNVMYYTAATEIQATEYPYSYFS